MLASEERETLPLTRESRRSWKFVPTATASGVGLARARRALRLLVAAALSCVLRSVIRTTRRPAKTRDPHNLIDAENPFRPADGAISVLRTLCSDTRVVRRQSVVLRWWSLRGKIEDR